MAILVRSLPRRTATDRGKSADMRMLHASLAVISCGAALGMASPVHPAGSRSFTTFDVPGATRTFPHGINAAGQIVGFFQEAAGPKHGFLRSPTGTFTTIDVPDAAETEPWGINNAGQIVGTFRDARLAYHGYLRAPESTFTMLDTLNVRDYAHGINAAGQTVGETNASQDGKVHPFLRGPGGAFITFNAPGDAGTSAYAINNIGQIVGVWDRPALWRHTNST